MTRALNLPALALLLLGFASSLGACESLAGIEDRTYDPAGAGPSTQCKAYCDLAMTVCTGSAQLFATNDTCYGICKRLDAGDPNEPTGDTVACRMNQLMLAQQTHEPGGAADYCAHAGSATNGTCATNCETYCALYSSICNGPDAPPNAPREPDDCVAKCAGLEDTHGFDVNANYYNDTLQCRLVHTSVASVSTANTKEHCPHAALPATGPCLGMDPTTTVPDCDSFCHLEMTECQGDLQQYESNQQCLNVCNALDKGTADDESGNTIACRKYHSYNALLDPNTHCPHTGPGGDGHCGSSAMPDSGSTGNCESYCTLLAAACTTDFNAAFKDQAACAVACAMLDGAGPNSGFSIAATGDNVQCRLLHTARAFEDPSECKAAEGAAPCK